MNIRKEIKRRFQKGDIIKNWRITRCKENNFLILILFSKITNRRQLLSTKNEVQTFYFVWTGAARIKHQFHLNRGRTDKQLHHVNRGRTENYKVKDWNKKMKSSIFDPTKIFPRGRSKTNHQLKFHHQQIFKNNRRPQFYKRK
jgi:hypothetical protein